MDLAEKPQVLALNKADLLAGAETLDSDRDVSGLLEEQGNAILVSALTGQGIESLVLAVQAKIEAVREPAAVGY